jgi:aminopeptidase N
VGLLEDFFDMPIPYGKLDVSVPPRFWGTMEHPGIVSMGQPLTLIKPAEESFQRKEGYANILIHELAHYWFGDYVTMQWWDETWLNEAMATWVDKKITDRFEPSWRYRMEALNATASAMSADALVSTKAIRQPITKRTDIESSFDGAITYNKGSQVIAMFEQWVGPEKFRSGVLRYLRDHAHGTAVATDLLKALDAETGRDVSTPFLTFLDQPGVPLVSASLKCEPGRPPRLELSQERYLPEGSTGSSDQTWQIPITVRYGVWSKMATASTLLTQESGELVLNGLLEGCPDWVIVNDGAVGYYHVKYDGRLRQGLRLMAGRGGGLMSPAERATFLADVNALVAGGQMFVGEALDLVPDFVRDPDRFVFSGAMQLFGWTHRDFLPEALLPNYDRAVVKLLGPRAKALGWKEKKGESNDVQVLRPWVVPAVAISESGGPLAAEGQRLADRWLTSRGGVDPDLITSALRVAAVHADRAWFDRCVAEARKTSDLQDRRRILSSLGNVRDAKLTPDVLALLLDDSFDLRDTQVIMFQTLGHRETRDTAYEWVKAHYDAVFPRLREDEQSRLMSIPGNYCDPEHRADAEAFFGPRAEKVDGGPQTLRRSLERVDLCVAALARNREGVEAFLKRY